MEMNSPVADSQDGVDVYMFRQGFGDCFLLKFFREQERPFTMMIDCGVLKGTPNEDEKLAEVATCIRELIVDDQIDVLMLTHAHYDHVSGFLPDCRSRKIFEKIKFGQLWLPWTENEHDAEAARLKKQHVLRVLALKAAIDSSDRSQLIAPIMKFYGTQGFFESTTIRLESELAIEEVCKMVGNDSEDHRYWRGGDSTELPGTCGARVFFLGPQYQLEPPGVHATDATITADNRLGVNKEQGQLIALLERQIGAESTKANLEKFKIPPVIIKEMSELSIPFAQKWRQDASILKPSKSGTKKKLTKDQTQQEIEQQSLRDFVMRDSDLEPTKERRGIRIPETEMPLDLAVRLDETTNQTSLAIAIELPKTGKVLLFPGDAPSKAWKSWCDLSWLKFVDDESPTITGKQLLSQTAFYKVSQNGSAAGTSNENGLELLSPDVIAMLPIDKETPREEGWNLPFPQVLEALHKKTNDRVISAANQSGSLGDFDPKPGKLLGRRFVRINISDQPTDNESCDDEPDSSDDSLGKQS